MNRTVIGCKEGELLMHMVVPLNNNSIPSLQGLALFVALPHALDSANTIFALKELCHLSFLECWH
jgi:hypothetical protein